MPEVLQGEVFAASAPCLDQTSSSSSGKTVVVAWRALLDWVSFLLEILLQLLRGTPSLARALSSLCPSPPPSFKPLPAEIPPDSVVSVDPPLPRLTLVLDLDETLVCAYETSTLPDVIRSQAIEAGLTSFDLECISSEKDADGRTKVNRVTVFERPGLQEFLQQTSEFADLVLFTAGLEGYARPLVDRIDSDSRFSIRLYRPSTVTTDYREHVKDLSCISKDYNRIVIVDNNPFSFLLQPLNGIPCIPFYAGQPHDEQLMGFILPLLKQLSLEKDVRPVLYDTFHMPEWFQKHGIPMSDWKACDSPTSV